MFLSKKQKGFTLIELLIVITIIGILAAIAIPKFTQNKDEAYLSACKANLNILITAVEKYNFDNSTPLAAGADLSATLVPTYIKQMPVEPEGGSYTYEVVNGNLTVKCSKGHTL